MPRSWCDFSCFAAAHSGLLNCLDAYPLTAKAQNGPNTSQRIALGPKAPGSEVRHRVLQPGGCFLGTKPAPQPPTGGRTQLSRHTWVGACPKDASPMETGPFHRALWAPVSNSHPNSLYWGTWSLISLPLPSLSPGFSHRAQRHQYTDFDNLPFRCFQANYILVLPLGRFHEGPDSQSTKGFRYLGWSS